MVERLSGHRIRAWRTTGDFRTCHTVELELTSEARAPDPAAERVRATDSALPLQTSPHHSMGNGRVFPGTSRWFPCPSMIAERRAGPHEKPRRNGASLCGDHSLSRLSSFDRRSRVRLSRLTITHPMTLAPSRPAH